MHVWQTWWKFWSEVQRRFAEGPKNEEFSQISTPSCSCETWKAFINTVEKVCLKVLETYEYWNFFKKNLKTFVWYIAVFQHCRESSPRNSKFFAQIRKKIHFYKLFDIGFPKGSSVNIESSLDISGETVLAQSPQAFCSKVIAKFIRLEFFH